MFGTSYVIHPKNKSQTKEKVYTRSNNDYTPSSSSKFNEQYFERDSLETNYSLLIKNFFNRNTELINEEQKESIISQFLQDNTKYKLDYSLIKDKDSELSTVEIRSESLSLDQLFDLARELNRIANREDYKFIIIAGV